MESSALGASAFHVLAEAACGFDVAAAFGRADRLNDLACFMDDGIDCSLPRGANGLLDLGECLFDRVEVGAVGRQESRLRFCCADHAANAAALVAAEIIHHDNAAGPERGHEQLLDPRAEGLDLPPDFRTKRNASMATFGRKY